MVPCSYNGKDSRKKTTKKNRQDKKPLRAGYLQLVHDQFTDQGRDNYSQF